MENILYLDDYINYYSHKLNKIIVYKPYKDTLYKGRIIDKNKFIKSIVKLKEENKLNNNLFFYNIIIIVNKDIKK